MENTNYYEILGVSKKASLQEITNAKNILARQYHPDMNIKNNIDTTTQMQEILEAYEVLSDPLKRADYDRQLAGHSAQMQTYDLHEETEVSTEDPPIVRCWKAAGALYDIILESDALFKHHDRTGKLAGLSIQALKHILLLREHEIPERYWHPDIMNWILFSWYKNRNLPISYLLTRYDEHIKKDLSTVERIKLQNTNRRFCHCIKRLAKY